MAEYFDEEPFGGLDVAKPVPAQAPWIRARKIDRAKERRLEQWLARHRTLAQEYAEELRAQGWTPPLHSAPALPPNRAGWRFDDRASDRLSGGLFNNPFLFVLRGWGLYVITDVVTADYRGEACEQNHVSVSVPGVLRRPTESEMARVRADFAMEEDVIEMTSEGSAARHLYQPVRLPAGTSPST